MERGAGGGVPSITVEEAIEPGINRKKGLQLHRALQIPPSCREAHSIQPLLESFVLRCAALLLLLRSIAGLIVNTVIYHDRVVARRMAASGRKPV